MRKARARTKEPRIVATRERSTEEAQHAIYHLERLLEVGGFTAIVSGKDIAVAKSIAETVGTSADDAAGRKLLKKLVDLPEVNPMPHNPIAAFRAFASVAIGLARVVIEEERTRQIDGQRKVLEKFADKIGERVFLKDGMPIIGGNAGYIVVSDSGHLVLAVDCATPGVADAVENAMVGVLPSIPEARWVTSHGYTQIKFIIDPNNPAAIEWARQLKNQSGRVLQSAPQRMDRYIN